jgi:hypothetical protein
MAYVSVEIDVDDVLDQMDDKHLLREVKSRNLKAKGEPDAREIVSSAINMIRTGRVADGVTLLEREFLPRWKDVADCEEAYRQAMALKVAA